MVNSHTNGSDELGGGGGAGGGPTGNRSAGTGGDGLVVIAYPQGVT